MRIVKSFFRWWSKYGGNAHMSDLEAAYRAGWRAAMRTRRK